MAPEVNVVEGQNLCEERGRHKRSKSESHRDPAPAQNAGSVFQEHLRGSYEPKKQAGLAEHRFPGDRSCQHIHEEKAHSDPLNKQPELFSNSADISETRTNTTSSDTLSENEHPNSKAHFQQGQYAEATSKRELELERNAHSSTKAKLQSITTSLEAVKQRLKDKTRSNTALVGLHRDAQQRVKEREQHIHYLKFHHEHQYQSIPSAKDDNVRALQMRLDFITKKSEESLKAAKTEADVAMQERKKASESSKALQSQLVAANKENEKIFLTNQKMKDASDRELESTREDHAAYRRSAESSKSKLVRELQDANEDHQTTKEFYESEKNVNKKLESRIKVLEKRSSEAKEKVKTLHAEHKSEQSRLIIKIAELERRETTIIGENEKLQAELDSHIVQHNDQMNDLLQQVRDSQGLSQRFNFRLSDDEIVEEWQNLRHMIGQFVNKYTRPIQVPEPPLNSTLRALSPLISELLASPLLFASAFEAYVWEWISLTIFDPASLVWAGKLGRTFNELSSRVEDEIRSPGLDDELTSEYHVWRATSSNLLSRVRQRDSHSLSQYGDLVHLVDSLQALLGSEVIKDDVYCDLDNIVDNARAFDIMRRKVKSKIEVCFGGCDVAGVAQKYNIPVDDSVMRIRASRLPADLADPGLHSGPTVKLVVSPAIVRWGNSNGVDYDRKACLVKMDVLVSRTPDVVSQLSGGEHLGQRSNTVDEGGRPVENNTFAGKQGSNIKKQMYTETDYSNLPPPADQSTGQGQALSRSWSTGQVSQPRNAAQEGTKKRRTSELEQRNQRDELSGGPDDYKNTRDSKPTASKKLKSGRGGNSGR